ncbi:MAG: class I SAM-dependent methyltransferase [Chloroflexota bacterium]
MERILEPELMLDEPQALAYAGADFSDANAHFARLFTEKFPAITSGTVVDLGCGPADILIRLAHALPGVSLVGIDGSEAMLGPGRRAVAEAGLEPRIHLQLGQFPNVALPVHGCAAITSNSVLHHLPDGALLWGEALRLGASGAGVLVMDLLRPSSPAEAREIVQRVSPHDPPVLREDFFNSLCAAFTLEEVRAQLHAAGLPHFQCEQVSERHLAAWGQLPHG